MSHELYYTSLPAGLKPGSNGFCTVAATAGLPAATAQRLEMLSGYRDLYPPGDPRADRNPVAWSHWRLSPGVRAPSLLSRVGSAGMDYTGRANTFAHHLLLEPAEQPPAGPAWLLSQPGVLDPAWTGVPRTIPAGRTVPRADDPPAVCDAWAAAAGDPGWAGVLAATAAADAPRVAYLIYDPAAGHDPLALLRQAMALLPPARRWPVAFTTYFTDLPAGLACHWRCCVAGTPAAKDARRNATSGVVLDLTTAMGEVPETALVREARTGRLDGAPLRIASATLTPVTANGHDDGDISAADLPKPLPVDALARLTPRQPFGMPPLPPLLVGAVVNNGLSIPPDVTPSRPPAKTWVWVAAFAWPLLAIAGVVAWFLTATEAKVDAVRRPLQANIEQLRSDRDQLAAAKGGLTRDVAALKASAAVDEHNVRDLRGQLEGSKQESQAKITDLGDKLEQLQAKLAGRSSPENAGAQQIALNPTTREHAQLGPTTSPVDVADSARRIVIAPVFDEQRRILDPSIRQITALRFLNPFKSAVFPNSTDLVSGDKLPLKTIPTPGGNGVPTILGSISVDHLMGLLFTCSQIGSIDKSTKDARDALCECGVSVYSGQKLIEVVQLGEPEPKKVSLPGSDKATSVLPAGCRLPSKLHIVAGETIDSGWSCSGLTDGSGVLHVQHGTAGESGSSAFDVRFDEPKGEISTDWTAVHLDLSKSRDDKTAITTADQQIKSAVAELNFANSSSSSSGPTRDAIAKSKGEAQKKLDAANSAKQQAEATRKAAGDALKGLDTFRLITIRFIDPDSGLTLRVIKLLKD